MYEWSLRMQVVNEYILAQYERIYVMSITTVRKIQQVIVLSLWCVGSMVLSGCALLQPPDMPTPGGQTEGFPPTLSTLSVSPNPTLPGTIVNLTTSYRDPDADLQYGVAAVSVDGGKLSRIAFKTTYPSGILTVPLAVSHYSRASDVTIVLKIRDSSGNWSNPVSTVLSIRQ